jgi:hypothetical protein
MDLELLTDLAVGYRRDLRLPGLGWLQRDSVVLESFRRGLNLLIEKVHRMEYSVQEMEHLMERLLCCQTGFVEQVDSELRMDLCFD